MSWWQDLFYLAFLLIVGFSFLRMLRSAHSPIEMVSRDDTGVRIPYPSRLIRQAGMVPEEIRLYYWLAKGAFALLLPLLIVEALGGLSPALGILLGLLGFLIVDLWLLLHRRARRQQIEACLSYFADLIAAFLHSGLNLTESFHQAAAYGLPPKNPLVREVDLVAREMEAGVDRVMAFQALARRTGSADMDRLSALMAVGAKVGAPIQRTLQDQAELLRARQWERVDALIHRRSLEAMFPLVLVSLPLLGVLVFFPAVVQLYEMFRQFSGGY